MNRRPLLQTVDTPPAASVERPRSVEDLRTRPTWEVQPIADLIGVNERTLREQLRPGGDLEHLALRVGRRVFIRTARLIPWLEGQDPDHATA